MKLYLDIFFLLNAGMDFLVLLAQGMLRRQRIRFGKLITASLIGGILACVLTVSGVHKYLVLYIFFGVLSEVPIIRMAYGKTTARIFAGNLAMFYVLSCLFNGLMKQVEQLTGVPMSGTMVLLVSLVMLIVLYFTVPMWHRYRKRTSHYYVVRLTYGDKTIRSQALLDTGNHLQDPFTGEPVIIGNRDFLKMLWQEEPVFRVIPYRSVGTNGGTLKAFQADCLEIETEGEWKRIENPWVAIWSGVVSGEGEYEVILHPDMLI